MSRQGFFIWQCEGINSFALSITCRGLEWPVLVDVIRKSPDYCLKDYCLKFTLTLPSHSIRDNKNNTKFKLLASRESKIETGAILK